MLGREVPSLTRRMQIAPYIVMYIGLGLLFSGLVLLLTLEFFERMDRDRVDRDSDAELPVR